MESEKIIERLNRAIGKYECLANLEEEEEEQYSNYDILKVLEEIYDGYLVSLMKKRIPVQVNER